MIELSACGCQTFPGQPELAWDPNVGAIRSLGAATPRPQCVFGILTLESEPSSLFLHRKKRGLYGILLKDRARKQGRQPVNRNEDLVRRAALEDCAGHEIIAEMRSPHSSSSVLRPVNGLGAAKAFASLVAREHHDPVLLGVLVNPDSENTAVFSKEMNG